MVVRVTQRIIVGDIPSCYILSVDHLWEALRLGTPPYLCKYLVGIFHFFLVVIV